MNLTAEIELPRGAAGDAMTRELTQVILRDYEPKILRRILARDFGALLPDERAQVLELVQEKLDPEGGVMNTVFYNRRRRMIEERLEEYRNDEESLVLSGFLEFRLRDYREELFAVCEQAVEEFYAKREYDEFLDLLRFFVAAQSPREELVYLCCGEHGIRILNRYRRDITEQYLFDMIDLAPGENLTEEDLVLSALIAIAPLRIVMHGFPDPQTPFVRTISAVFPNTTFNS